MVNAYQYFDYNIIYVSSDTNAAADDAIKAATLILQLGYFDSVLNSLKKALML
jgi:hypothetical protein